MESSITVQLKSTSHLHNPENGSAAIMLNLRPEKGVLKAVGKKKQLTQGEQTLSASGYNKVFLHRNAEYEHWLGITSQKDLKWFNPATQTAIQSLAAIEYNDLKSVTIKALKGFIIVATDTKLYRFLYDAGDGQYNVQDITSLKAVIDGVIFTEGEIKEFVQVVEGTNVNSNDDLDADRVKAISAKLVDAIYQMQNKATGENYLPGFAAFRVAIRLFDNSLIYPSAPVLLPSSMALSTIARVPATGHRVGVYASQYQIALPESIFNLLEANNNVVAGLNIYASKPVAGFEITAENITKDDLLIDAPNGFAEKFPLASEYKTLNDSQSWTLVERIDLSDLRSIAVTDGVKKKVLNLEDYWTTYASRELMPVDSGSWHTLKANAQLIYNARLMLGDVTTTLSDGFPLKTIDPVQFNSLISKLLLWYHTDDQITYRYTNAETYQAKFITYIKTDEGDKRIVTSGTLPALKQFSWTTDGLNINYTELTNNHRLIPLPAQITYPDARAYKMVVAIKDGSGDTFRKLTEITLSPSKYQNFSQYIHVSYLESMDTGELPPYDKKTKHFLWQDIQADITAGVWSLDAFSIPSVQNILTDTNRVIASELNNPLYFPADTSYRIGNGRIMSLAVNTEAISTGQYGEHPVVVLTTDGIYAMLQGNFPVLFQAISPLSAESCISPLTIAIHSAIVFLSQKGVSLLSGQQVVILSDILDGTAFNPIRDLEIYGQITDKTELFNSQAVIDEVSEIREEFSGYLSSETLMGYDGKRNELILFTPEKAYSWHFAFAAKSWFRVSQNYSEVINSWPNCYLIGSSGDILDATGEVTTEAVEVMLQTNPVKMEGNFGINDLVFSCDLTPQTDTLAGVYLFGAERDDKYFILGGSQVSTRIRDYKSNTFSRMKVTDIIFILTAIVKPSECFVIPAIQMINKPKYNQVKS